MMSRILIVDDDAELRSEFRDCFEEYGIAEAASGEEALRLLKRPNEIDLVILDVRMPGMNGMEVLSRIRSVATDIRIVIFTGHGSKDVAVEALRGQADDYIEKPLDIDEAKELIEKFLGTKRGEPDTSALDIRDKIERVKDFLARNSLRKVTLKDACGNVCLSPKYLSRIFKEHTGVGFNEYKLKLKMEEAKKILTHTGYTVNQIADKLGYENPESFIRQFKRSAGKTPTEYRNKMRKKKQR